MTRGCTPERRRRAGAASKCWSSTPAASRRISGRPSSATKPSRRCASGRRRRAARWWTSGRTSSAGCACAVRGEAGTEIVVRHAEVLEHDELGVRPLRSAQATDRFILSGGRRTAFEPTRPSTASATPRSTGWPGELTPGALEAVVVHSDLRRTGHVRMLRPDAQPAAPQRGLGHARQLPRRPDRLPAARRAARLDRRPRRLRARPRPSSTTSAPSCATGSPTWPPSRGPHDGMVPFVVPDVLKYEHATRRSSPSRRPLRSGATRRCGCPGRCGRPTATATSWTGQLRRPWPRTSAAWSRCSRRPACGTPASSSATGSTRTAPPDAALQGQGRHRRRRHRLLLPDRVHRSRTPRHAARAGPTTPRHFRRLAEPRSGPAFNEHYVERGRDGAQRLRHGLRAGDRVRPARRRHDGPGR